MLLNFKMSLILDFVRYLMWEIVGTNKKLFFSFNKKFNFSSIKDSLRHALGYIHTQNNILSNMVFPPKSSII